MVDGGGDDQGFLFQRQAVGFDLGQIEDIVDDAEQMLAGHDDAIQLFLLPHLPDFLLQQMGIADDGVHWRTDFMAHVGEEGAFGLVGDFGLLFGIFQLPRTHLDQFFQLFTVHVHLPFDHFAFCDIARDALHLGDVACFIRNQRSDHLGRYDTAVSSGL